MGYIIKNNQGFIISRLTDVGRRKISQGNFNISYFQIGDSEVNYTANTSSSFSESSYMVLEPAYNSQNDVGVPQSTKNAVKYPYYLQPISGITYGIPFQASSVDSVFNTASPTGLFSANTTYCSANYSTSSQYYYNLTDDFVLNDYYSFSVSNLGLNDSTFTLVANSTCGTYNGTISVGSFISMYILNTSSTANPDPFCKCLLSARPILMFKVKEINGTTVTVDRFLPNLSNYGSSSGRAIFYPGNFSSYDLPTPFNYWASSVINFESVCTPEDGRVKIWNMNIPWSESPAGTNTATFTFQNFGSVNYLSTKEYYGYSTSNGQIDTSGTSYYNSFGTKIMVKPEDQKSIAIVHYTNNTIINFYGEKFAAEVYDSSDPGATGQARNFKIVLPWLMWHKNSSPRTGAVFYIDPPGFDSLDLLEPFYIQSTKNNDMNNPGMRYYHLYDTNANSMDGGRPNRVGKVFPDDKTIIFDDEEIVAAMSYASNRNYTLPAPALGFTTPSSASNGILENDTQSLWVTYLFDNDGIWDGMHCNYYEKIVGPSLECTNSEQDVIVRFGGDFSCLGQPTTSIADGFFAINFYILAQKTTTGARPSPDQWRIINFTNQLSTGGYINANGFISPTGMISSTFTITNSNYTNASIYKINDYLPGLPLTTDNATTKASKIQFGDEYFFFGSLETDIEATIYEMRYLINLPGNQFLKPSNPTWTEGVTPYMTEIGLYDDDKNLLVYSKFQSPQIRQGIQQAVVKLDF